MLLAAEARSLPSRATQKPFHSSLPQLPDDCDSNMARAIQASLEDARAMQAAQAPEQQAAAGMGAAAGEAVMDSTAVAPADPARPSDADIIAWENQIR